MWLDLIKMREKRKGKEGQTNGSISVSEKKGYHDGRVLCLFRRVQDGGGLTDPARKDHH